MLRASLVMCLVISALDPQTTNALPAMMVSGLTEVPASVSWPTLRALCFTGILACDAACAKCKGSSSNCSSCQNTYFLDSVNFRCGTSCPSGTFMDFDYNNCSLCHPLCTNCLDGTNLNCTACANATYNIGSACLRE